MDRKEILRNLDISAALRKLGVDVRREVGGRADCRCPLHEDNTPSFVVDLEDGIDKRKGRWKCYAGCTSKMGNSIFDLAIELGYAKDFKEAAEYLLGGEIKTRRHEPLPSKGTVKTVEPQQAIDQEDVSIQKEALWADALALNYLRVERGISSEVLEEYSVGLSRDRKGTSITLHQSLSGGEPTQTKHIRFPKGDDRGPRFWSSKGFKSMLWPPPCMDVSKFKHVVVVESELDALFLQTAGINATATAGTSGYTLKKIRPLLDAGLHVFIMTDWDDAGFDAWMKLREEAKGVFQLVNLSKEQNANHKDIGEFFKIHGLEKTIEPILDAIDQFSPDDGSIVGRLEINDANKVKRHIGNLRVIVESDDVWRGKLWRNVMSGFDMFGDRMFCDEDITRAKIHMHDVYGVSWSENETFAVLKLACANNPRHLVREYLKSLRESHQQSKTVRFSWPIS